jgi:hypothetical protein
MKHDDAWYEKKYGTFAQYFKEYRAKYEFLYDEDPESKNEPESTGLGYIDEWYCQTPMQNDIDMEEYNSKDPKTVEKRVKRFYRQRLKEMSEQVTMRDSYYVRYGIQGSRPKSRLNPFFAVMYVMGKMFGTDTEKFEIHGVRVDEELDTYIVEVTLARPGFLIGTMGRTVDALAKELTKVFDKKCEVKIVEAKSSFLSKQVDNNCY